MKGTIQSRDVKTGATGYKRIKTFRGNSLISQKNFERNPGFERIYSQQVLHRKDGPQANDLRRKISQPSDEDFQINILEEDTSGTSLEDDTQDKISPKKTAFSWMSKRFGGANKVKVKRRSQPPVVTKKIQGPKKFLVAKKIIRDGKKVCGPLPGSIDYDLSQGEDKFLTENKNIPMKH
ncbi:unnamed protein product [Moneuplotes crassus]|uniref:Uncharacterized protein n=1 Tax=Euplotes crassus TaxID=5936 RepID=A0AAD1TZK4_EUPCR|nr:unnamed protein product [Moneuplotes crassus]